MIKEPIRRETEDYFVVTFGEKVYEILWVYYNAEISIAEPHETTNGNVPEPWPIWLKKNNCQRECDKLNEENRKTINELIYKFR